ncbi:hypothetical protein PAMC26577_34400 [Caballeronia sordidicola]|uniref:Uncharacterized protein n=1 Tax=Caballeronia sordidicola TaxID=196367 RepID=A0A242MAJ6_CABSO|nr:hypothetical protein PAMC26577_34400 [Caballeronia sordidicola]
MVTRFCWCNTVVLSNFSTSKRLTADLVIKIVPYRDFDLIVFLQI